MIEFVFMLPIIMGLLVLALPASVGRVLLLVTALLHLQLTLMTWLGKFTAHFPLLFKASPEGLYILLITSFIFLCITVYSFTYVDETEMGNKPVFNGCMLLFLGTMSMVTLSDHPIMLWVAVEATTLVSAPLIFIHRSKEALEATWKYVIICSVGIALALLGCFFMTLSLDLAKQQVPLSYSSLYTVATTLDPIWLKTGFIFVIIGFGTKMGLAPMHTWLPDAHSQAPSPASSLLSGALLNCAFLGIYKMHILMVSAGLGDYSSQLLIGFGLLSMFVGAVFIVNQPDYKRMLAYSSIKNMGIVAFGVGIGGFALYGAFLHILHHSLIKSSLFLSAGNILIGFNSKQVQKIGGVIKYLPRTFVSFMAGFIAISGLPPFGLFISEVIIIIGAIQVNQYLALAVFLLAVIIVFAGFSKACLGIAFGDEVETPQTPEKLLRIIPPYALLTVSAVMTVWIPQPIYNIIINSIQLIGGKIHG